MTTEIDINKIIQPGAVVVSNPEHDDERKARLKREEKSHDWQIRKDQLATAVVMGSYITLTGTCLFVLYNSNSIANSAAIQLAQVGLTALITGVVTGVVGFLVGQKSKR